MRRDEKKNISLCSSIHLFFEYSSILTKLHVTACSIHYNHIYLSKNCQKLSKFSLFFLLKEKTKG